jgi:hypothetical protein
MAKTFLNNFTSGEWSRLLGGRVDYERYNSACRKLENFIVMPYGGARFRPGFVLRVYDSSSASVTEPVHDAAHAGGAV